MFFNIDDLSDRDGLLTGVICLILSFINESVIFDRFFYGRDVYRIDNCTVVYICAVSFACTVDRVDLDVGNNDFLLFDFWFSWSEVEGAELDSEAEEGVGG